jgi:uncharacterized integral membrane protein (TIGR00697 family)
MKNYKYYSIITGIFVAALLISNVLDTKVFILFGLTLPAGIILFPIVYLFGDIFTEVYGYKASRKAIWTAFFSLLMAVVFFKIGELIEPAPFWENQQAFVDILGKIPRIATASVVAFFLGEFTNSITLSKMKLKSAGKSMPLRFIVSTIFGQAVDTTVFVLIAFAGLMPFDALISITLSAWAFKVIWEVIALPITIPVVKWLKRTENEDAFDNDVNYNPFKLD